MTSLAGLPAAPSFRPTAVPPSLRSPKSSLPAANSDGFDSFKGSAAAFGRPALSPLDAAFNPVGRAVKSTKVESKGFLSSMGPESLIAGYVKSTLNAKTDAEMKSMVKQYFVTMKLMNEEGEWAHPKLAAIGESLFPSDMKVEDFRDLVDSMAENASENPYVHEFLTRAQGEDFPELYAKLQKQGAEMIPGFAAYAMTLQRLTVAMREDHEVSSACEKIWRAERAKVGGAYENIGFEGAVKYHSVEYPVSSMNAALEAGEIDPQFGRVILPVNIIEAMLYDMATGNNDNAKAGWITATHRPGNTPNAATGAGDTVLTEDGNGVSVNMPLPKDWADLYHAWNMAFVSQFAQFPYSMVKLLIPEVSDYQDEPSEYIHTRALALYAHLNFILFRPQGDEVGGAGAFDWSTPEMTKIFGEVNKEKAEEYAAEVDRLNPSLSTQVKNAIVNFFMSIYLFFQSIPDWFTAEPAPAPAPVMTKA